MTCRGEINGQEITGPGTFGEEGVLEGVCSHGSGFGTAAITIPTSSGPTKLTIPYTLRYGPGVGTKSADQFSATFEFYPTEGDCINTPVTEIAFALQAVLKT